MVLLPRLQFREEYASYVHNAWAVSVALVQCLNMSWSWVLEWPPSASSGIVAVLQCREENAFIQQQDAAGYKSASPSASTIGVYRGSNELLLLCMYMVCITQ